VLELNTDKLAATRKQSIERKLEVLSVVYLTGLKIEVIVVGREKFMDREAETI